MYDEWKIISSFFAGVAVMGAIALLLIKSLPNENPQSCSECNCDCVDCCITTQQENDEQSLYTEKEQ